MSIRIGDRRTGFYLLYGTAGLQYANAAFIVSARQLKAIQAING